MSKRWFAAVPWRGVLLANDVGWIVRWANEHGAWMEHSPSYPQR